MALIDSFVRGGGETTPYLLSNHTPFGGGSWGGVGSGNWCLSPDGFARINTGGAVSRPVWSIAPASADYEVGMNFIFRSWIAAAGPAIVLRGNTAGSQGQLMRATAPDATGAVTLYVADAFGSFTSNGINSIAAGVFSLNNQYYMTAKCVGNVFSISIYNVVTGQWLNSGGTAFNSATRQVNLTATVAGQTQIGLIGIQDYIASTDTTGSAILDLSYDVADSNPGITTVSMTGPTSGLNSVASTNFTVSTVGPNASTIVVTPSDNSGGGSFTPSSVSLTAGSPSATFTYTPTINGNRFITVSTNNAVVNGTNSINYVVTGNATSVLISSPSSTTVGVASPNFTASANGTITGTVIVTPSDSGSGGTFTPSTVSISSGTPTATFTYTPSSTGVKSISVTNNGSLTNPSAISLTVTANQTVYLDDSRLCLSPTNWNLTGTAGSKAAETVWAGSYIRLKFDGTSLVINLDTSGLTDFPWVNYQIDGVTPVDVKLTSGQTVITITGLSSGSHTFEFVFMAFDNRNNTSSWIGLQQLRVLSFLPSGGSGFSACQKRSKKAIIWGDSITAGLAVGDGPLVIGGGRDASVNSYSNIIGKAIDAEFDQCGAGSQGWKNVGSQGFPTFLNSYNLKKSGISRTLSNYDYIIVNHGTNDILSSSGLIVSEIQAWIGAIRTASPNAVIFICVPFGGFLRASLTTAVSNYLAANPIENKITLVDLGSFYEANLTAFGSGTYFSTDGIHPNLRNSLRLGGILSGILKQFIQSLGQERSYGS